MKSTDLKPYIRPSADYKNLSHSYRLTCRDYTKQFAHIYGVRLNKTKDILLERVSLKWGSDCPIMKISDLNDTITEECIIIGTFFKHQQLKPNILKEFSEELTLVPEPEHKHFVSDSDQLILEDEVQRILLRGNIQTHNQVTGVVVALKGLPVDNGKFHVSDICYATPQLSPRITQPSQLKKQIVFMSGINAASCDEPVLAQLYTLIQLLTGWLGGDADLEEGAEIVRVVIVGNTVRNFTKEKITLLTNTVDLSEADLEAMDLADKILTDIASFIDVDIMPGEFDPANVSLPQQPLHPCLFPKASKYSTFHPVTNPYKFEIDGKLILGTSGQSVQDISKCSNLTNALSALEYTLTCGHLAPTAPDTVACYPFYDNDPLIIDSMPDVYFAGNQTKFETKTAQIENGKSVQLISVPDFFSTKTVAVLDLGTLECHSLTIDEINEDR